LTAAKPIVSREKPVMIRRRQLAPTMGFAALAILATPASGLDRGGAEALDKACSREIPDKGLRNRWADLAARKSFEPDPVRTGVGMEI
jgi:hypothetical protein